MLVLYCGPIHGYNNCLSLFLPGYPRFFTLSISSQSSVINFLGQRQTMIFFFFLYWYFFCWNDNKCIINLISYIDITKFILKFELILTSGLGEPVSINVFLSDMSANFWPPNKNNIFVVERGLLNPVYGHAC